MFWPFNRNKYDKLTRESVVEAICKLEQESDEIDKSFETYQKRYEEILQKGRKEKDRNMKLLYAKKANMLQAERDQNVQRMMYIMYNVQLLNKLKQAIDDNAFYKKTSAASLNNLLSDQKRLAQFLNGALNTRIAAEDVLTSADETFKNIQDAYEPNQSIYGVNESDDSLLAMFEEEEMVASEQEMYGESAAAQSVEEEEK